MSWRDQQLHAMVAASAVAQREGDMARAQLELQKASLLGVYSTIPSEGWLDFYTNIGRYDLAADQLQAWPRQIDNQRIGQYYLQAQQYDRALPFVQKALVQESTPERYRLQAVAYFNLKQVEPGCEASGKALKAHLSSSDGLQLAQACQILQRGIDSRAEVYQLIEQGIVVPAVQYLQDQPEKTPSDWSLLASLAMARGQFDKAQTDLAAGLKIDPTNSALLAQILRCETAQKNQSLAKKQQNLLDLLNFKY